MKNVPAVRSQLSYVVKNNKFAADVSGMQCSNTYPYRSSNIFDISDLRLTHLSSVVPPLASGINFTTEQYQNS